MNLSNIQVGQEFKNYKALCNAIEEEVKTGGAKNNQIKKWEDYFEYNKVGNKFIITKIKQNNIITITEKELIETYGADTKNKYNKDGQLSSNSRAALLKNASRYCDIEYNKITKKYDISNVYKYPVPKKMLYMKKGLYQYMIPLLLLKLKNEHDDNNKILLSADNLAKMIYMHNANYNAIKYNQRIICSDKVINQNIKVGDYSLGFDLTNSYDYFTKADYAISYHIKKSLSMLQEIGLIISQNVQMLLYTEKVEGDTDNQVLLDEEGNGVIFKKKRKMKHRIATDKEISDNLIMQQETDKEVGLNTKEKGIQARYYSKISQQWTAIYNKKLQEYSKDLDYDIVGFCNYYEVHAGDIKQCDECLHYFDSKDENKLTEQFNREFYNYLINNAQLRIDKKNKDYNTTYIEDFANLAGITIFKDSNSSTVQETIRNNPLEIRVRIEEY